MTPIATIKAIVDLLADLEINPLSVHLHSRHQLDGIPNLMLNIGTITDMYALCTALGITAKRRQFSNGQQRRYWAESDTVDTGARRLLIECVSYPHHDDWEAPA